MSYVHRKGKSLFASATARRTIFSLYGACTLLALALTDLHLSLQDIYGKLSFERQLTSIMLTSSRLLRRAHGRHLLGAEALQALCVYYREHRSLTD